MRLVVTLPAVFVLALGGAGAQQPPVAPALPDRPAGARLEDLAWPDAEQRLRPGTVVVLPLGPAAQQHGPHLKLGNDAALAGYFARRLLDLPDVVVAPSLAYHHFPAFVEYPGSVTLSLETARDLTADVARSLASHGPRRVYVLSTAWTPPPALAQSARVLAAEGILLRYTDVQARLDAAVRGLQRQALGLHADEIETSMMLYADPAAVDMDRAVREYGVPSSPLRLTRRQGAPGTYSATGVVGDARLATREKGRELVETLFTAMRRDIEELRAAAPPSPSGPSASAQARRAGPPAAGGDRFMAKPGECLPGDDRAIRGIGPAFYAAWRHQDAPRLSGFWTADGDMVHPDGFTEGSAQAIRQNRAALFMRPEYKHSRHLLSFGEVRCITDDVAVADAKWELSGLTDARGHNVPPMDGLCTLVLRRTQTGWRIEAYRYSMSPLNATRPTLLQRPG